MACAYECRAPWVASPECRDCCCDNYINGVDDCGICPTDCKCPEEKQISCTSKGSLTNNCRDFAGIWTFIKRAFTVSSLPAITQSHDYILWAVMTFALIVLTRQFSYNQLLWRTEPHAKYHYVVLGSGAGSAIAARIADAGYSVLLLEPGGPYTVVSETPSLDFNNRNSSVDWQFISTPQSGCFRGYTNNQERISQGKLLGGTSSIGDMSYGRGRRCDFDRWAAQTNSPQWSYDGVLPYFLRAENETDPDYLSNTCDRRLLHSDCGPISVSTIQDPWPPYRCFVEASKSLGVPERDYSYPEGDLTAIPQCTVNWQGRRSSTADAYLSSRRHDLNCIQNLHVIGNAWPTKILIDPNTKRTYAVEYVRFGDLPNEYCKFLVEATEEVIVSLGAIKSPQILMLSGIGHADHLANLEIPCIADLPVGDNYHDQVTSYGIDFFTHFRAPDMLCLDPAIQYLVNYTGALIHPEEAATTIHCGCDTCNEEFLKPIDFMNKQAHKQDRGDKKVVEGKCPDVTLYLKYGAFNRVPDYTHAQNIFNIAPQIYNPYFAPLYATDYFSCMATVLRPKSRGWVRLASDDPFADPIINPNVFSDPRDMKILIRGMRKCYEVLRQHAMRDCDANAYRTLVPGCEKYWKEATGGSHNYGVLPLISPPKHRKVVDEFGFSPPPDRYLECVARTLTATASNPAGSCKMGSCDDRTAVVDTELNVLDVSGLRVCDASIMPSVTAGNTRTQEHAIAEICAELVLQSCQKKKK